MYGLHRQHGAGRGTPTRYEGWAWRGDANGAGGSPRLGATPPASRALTSVHRIVGSGSSQTTGAATSPGATDMADKDRSLQRIAAAPDPTGSRVWRRPISRRRGSGNGRCQG